MALATFYFPSLNTTSSVIELSAEESNHALKSRRLVITDQVNIINGKGHTAKGEIVSINKRSVKITIDIVKQHAEPERVLHLYVAIPKRDRQKFMIDQITQIGVRKITPLICERSITKFKSSLVDKWERIAIEACKQSQNPWLPEFSNAIELSSLINDQKNNASFYYADIGGEKMKTLSNHHSELALIVGPEGGFSNSELRQLSVNKITPVSLSTNILRIESAAIVASALFIH